jgi:hypothetical protein
LDVTPLVLRACLTPELGLIGNGKNQISMGFKNSTLAKAELFLETKVNRD